jgi:hypothetical protein
MQFDELKEFWTAHGTMLERSLAIDQRLLREALLRKVRHALAPYVLWRALELALGIALLVIVLSVLAAHASEQRYLIVGGTLAVLVGAITARCAHLLVNALRLDYGGPVVRLQREVEQLRLAELRTLQWALLGGVAAWLPAGLILSEALSGVPALARVDPTWLAANLVLGLLFLALGRWWSRRHLERTDLGPHARRWVDFLSGRTLRSVDEHLAELARFEQEEPPA